MVNELDPHQCRVAREALGWTQKVLAQKSGLGFTTVKRFELGQPVDTAYPLKLRKTLADAGVVLYDGGAVVEGRTVRFGLVLLDLVEESPTADGAGLPGCRDTQLDVLAEVRTNRHKQTRPYGGCGDGNIRGPLQRA